MTERKRPAKLKKDDLRVCNCAQCKVELVARDQSVEGRTYKLKVVWGRLRDRPYCRECFRARVPKGPR